MYSVLDYGFMATDRVRMDAYARAIARAVKPGAVVLDIGTGTGICTLLAARAGARHVHAVDVNAAVWLAREVAAENGLADRITFHQRSSFDLVLPEQVDVIVSDMRGVTPLADDHTAVIRDARRRLLKPGGTMLPVRDRLFVAAAESESVASKLSLGWKGFERLGFESKAVQSSVLNTSYTDARLPLFASDVLTTSEPWHTLEYATYDGAAPVGSVDLDVRRPGSANCLVVWFEATIFEDLQFSTAPGQALVYGRLILPLAEPVRLDERDRMAVTLRVDERGERWGWDTTVVDAAGATKARLRQATFLGAPASPNDLLRSSMATRPSLSEKGARVHRVLGAMDGQRTVEDLVGVARGGSDEAAPLSNERLVDQVRAIVSSYAK
jgi:protein arginine N-methyltransferase 1